jgi:sugar phosphate isomerase/epimerase
MRAPNRRRFLGTAAAATFLAGGKSEPASRTGVDRKGCSLSIGTYSLKGIALEEAITLVAGIGYDGIDIATQTGFDGEPSKMPPSRRQDVRKRLDAAGLALTALMEQISPSVDDARQATDVDRLARVADLARELSPDRPPLIQTVLGGGSWDEKKALFRDRLGGWVDATRRRGVVLAVKPHRGGALSRPSEAVWLIRQLGDTRWLRMVYDYSHYAFRGMTVEGTVREALPYTAHVVVKDAVERGPRVEFVLPGESGAFDYGPLLRPFYAGGYRGDVCCEVSSMVSNTPAYDPRAAARTCYANMARAFEAAEVPRA